MYVSAENWCGLLRRKLINLDDNFKCFSPYLHFNSVLYRHLYFQICLYARHGGMCLCFVTVVVETERSLELKELEASYGTPFSKKPKPLIRNRLWQKSSLRAQWQTDPLLCSHEETSGHILQAECGHWVFNGLSSVQHAQCSCRSVQESTGVCCLR